MIIILKIIFVPVRQFWFMILNEEGNSSIHKKCNVQGYKFRYIESTKCFDIKNTKDSRNDMARDVENTNV